MILTEEQRAALKRVVAYMDEMYAIASPYYGCTEDVDLLRATIDGSGTVEPAGGFDLEKARAADEVLPYPLDAKEIWVSGKGQMHINPPNAPSIFFTLSDLCEFRNIFHGQAAEIERLRAIIDTPSEEPEWVVDFKKLNRFAGAGYSLIDIEIAKKWHTAYRKAQNSNLLRKQEIERLRGEMENYGDDYVCQMKSKDARIQELKADLEQSERVVEARLDVIDQQAAKIRELEDAHKRSGARYAKIINELRSSVYANIPGLKKQWDEILNAPANGKIGPEDA